MARNLHNLLVSTMVSAVCLTACPPVVSSPDANWDVNLNPRPDGAADVQFGPPWCSMGTDIPGASVPGGFCMREYTTLANARTLAVAPSGEVFVAAPSSATPGGAVGGPGGIVVLSDDDHDGRAEQTVFLEGIPDVHGLAIGVGYLYFTSASGIYRTPYAAGQRVETPNARESLDPPSAWGSGGRWTHGLALSVSGHLYGSRGEYASCGGTPGGAIYEVNAGTLTNVATGFRNPMYMRCHSTADVCMASELGEDQTPGAKEKLLSIRTATNYGYPCCFGRSQPDRSECATVTPEEVSIPLGDTPFGLDWERSLWPAPWNEALFVAKHGSFYTQFALGRWEGAGVVFAQTDPTTHLPTGTFSTFIDGFGNTDRNTVLKRPADIAFDAAGRMFVADDQAGRVYWIAPTALRVRL